MSAESNTYQMISLPQVKLPGKQYLQQSISQLKKHRVLPDRLHKSNSSNLTLKPEQPKTPLSLNRIRQPTLITPLAQALKHEIEVRREDSLKRAQEIEQIESSLDKFQTVKSRERRFKQTKQPQIRLIFKDPKSSRQLQPLPQKDQIQSRYNLATKSQLNPTSLAHSASSSSSSQHQLSEPEDEQKCQCSSEKKNGQSKKSKGKVRFLKRVRVTPTTRFQTVVTDEEMPKSDRRNFQVLNYGARDFQTIAPQVRSSSVLNTLCCMGNKAQKYSEDQQGSDSNCQLQ